MKNILLTGGAGFIGSHTCLALMEKGYNVFVIDSFVNSSPKALERVLEIYRRKKNMNKVDLKIFNIDLCSKDCIKKVFLELRKLNKNVDGVIHFAGLKAVSDSVEDPIAYFDNNVAGTISLLNAMQKAKVGYFIFSSSATVYGEPSELPIKETHALLPTNPYGQSKLYVENILSSLCRADKNFKCVSLRYFNPAGAHTSGLIGESTQDTPNNLFPFISQVIEGKRDFLNIFGNDYPTKDGTGVRDYIHIEDLIDGHLAALNFLINNSQTKNYSVFNLGTGKGYSVKEIISTYENVNRLKIPINYAERRKGDIAENYADPSLANEKLKWKTKRKLEDICLSIAKYISSRK